MSLLDACTVNNGGCGDHAACSHESETNAVKCSCNTGYVNTGTADNYQCTGRQSYLVSM